MQSHPAPTSYHNPKIHSDLLALYTHFFSVHKNMSKYLRITILESEILGALSSMMRTTIHINVMKGSQVKPTLHELLTKIHELRSYLENIKAFTVLLWRTKAISEGFFIQVSASTEEISKQIVGWEKYLTRQMMPQTHKETKVPKK